MKTCSPWPPRLRASAPRRASGRDRHRAAGVHVAPFADRQNATIVKEALNLDDNVSTADLTGSQRAGTGAMIQALQMAAGGAAGV